MKRRRFQSAIYGWSLMFRPAGPGTHWVVDVNQDVDALPAIFENWGEAVDRLEFLEGKGLDARLVAVLVQPNDYEDRDGTLVNKYVTEQKPMDDGGFPKSKGEEP